ncbi:MAG: hypothetical protein ACLQF4_00650 [Xanthobacteraceae bacterium]
MTLAKAGIVASAAIAAAIMIFFIFVPRETRSAPMLRAARMN